MLFFGIGDVPVLDFCACRRVTGPPRQFPSEALYRAQLGVRRAAAAFGPCAR